MIRLRPLRPREVRSIRHWAIELLVVVFGVLIALWAQDWFEGRRDEQRLAELESAMQEELRNNYWLFEFHEAHRVCHRDFSARMREMLLTSEGRWPGLSTGFNEGGSASDELPVGIIPIETPQVSLSAWRNAEDSGLLARMDVEQVERYRRAYQQLMILDSAIKSIEQARNRLSGLIDPVPLPDDARIDALRDLVAFNNGLFRRTMIGAQIVESLKEAGVASNDALEQRFADSEAYTRENMARFDLGCLVALENQLPREVESQ